MRYFGFILFDVFSKLLAVLPKRVMYVFADLLFCIGLYIIRYRKKTVYRNLQNAFPEKSAKEIKKIAKRFFRHLSDVVIENIAMLHMNPKRLKRFVHLNNPELLNELFRQERNIMGILGHYGNWELLTTISLHTPYTVLSVYKPLKNKFFDRKVYEMRKRFNEIPVPMKQAFKHIAQYQQSGKPYGVGMVADQSPSRKSINYWTTFLNQETPFYTGAEKIARKYNHTVVFPAVRKIKRGSYEIEYSILSDDPKETSENEITETYVKALENLIREKPEYWLWSHRRWKHKLTI
jgi:KDO2-lipid IV(A) lauroyltransferase